MKKHTCQIHWLIINAKIKNYGNSFAYDGVFNSTLLIKIGFLNFD